jgi:hypothetical protein
MSLRSPVALSKKSLATAEGAALLTRLEQIMADGCLADKGASGVIRGVGFSTTFLTVCHCY